MIPDMSVHTIRLPVGMREEMRADLFLIVWDDEAGTVEGDHPLVPRIRRVLDAEKPVTVGTIGGTWDLRDPGRDPVEMLTLLRDLYWPAVDEPLRSTLPPVFDGLDVPAPEPGEMPPGTPLDVDEAACRRAGRVDESRERPRLHPAEGHRRRVVRAGQD